MLAGGVNIRTGPNASSSNPSHPMQGSTFAFSDDELLDALRQFDDSDESANVGVNPMMMGAGMPVLPTPSASMPMAMSAPINVPMVVVPPADPSGSGSSPGFPEDVSAGPHPDMDMEGDMQPRPTRKRRKHELDAMRALASSLETQLQALQQRHSQATAGKNVFWKHVADHLLLDKQRAVNENARLRDVFNDQAKVLKSIQRTLHKSPGMERLGDAATTQSAAVAMSSSPESYNQVFQDLAQAYKGTDSIMQQAGLPLANPCDDARRVNMEMRTEKGKSVMCTQVAECRTVPYDVGTVGENVWRFLAGPPSSTSDGDSIFQRKYTAKGDGLFGVTKIEVSLGLYSIEFDVGLRRFVDRSRVTIVWEGSGMCHSERCPANSFCLREKGWVVFEPSLVEAGKSVFRACVQFIPTPSDKKELSSDAKDIGLITELTMTMYEQTIGCVYQAVWDDLQKRERAV